MLNLLSFRPGARLIVPYNTIQISRTIKVIHTDQVLFAQRSCSRALRSRPLSDRLLAGLDQDLHRTKLLLGARHGQVDLFSVRNVGGRDVGARATAAPMPLEVPVSKAALFWSEPAPTRRLSSHSSVHKN